MLTRMSDRTLSPPPGPGPRTPVPPSAGRQNTITTYVKHGGKIYYSRSRVLEALRNEPNTTSTNKVKKS